MNLEILLTRPNENLITQHKHNLITLQINPHQRLYFHGNIRLWILILKYRNANHTHLRGIFNKSSNHPPITYHSHRLRYYNLKPLLIKVFSIAYQIDSLNMNHKRKKKNQLTKLKNHRFSIYLKSLCILKCDAFMVCLRGGF